MKRHLLIAGHGFLGHSLAEAFTQAGWLVTKTNRSGRDQAQCCDLSDPSAVHHLASAITPDVVIQCASTGGGGADAYRDVYLTSARNLHAAFLDARHVFVSSTSVYAQVDHSSVTEESEAEPTTETGKILRLAEEEVLSKGGVVARLSGLYGEGRCHFLRQFLAGESRMDGKGDRVLNFIHRKDAASALLLLAETEQGGIYNITATPSSQRECFQQLATHYQRPMPETSDPAVQPQRRKRGNSSKAVSNQKIKSLGWQPEYEDFLSLALACAG
ncbi:MAG: NAD-dependent epimerase/dehydratase family protein [Akkermansiaceae bacterium]